MRKPSRTFIAIELDDSLRRAIAAIQSPLERARAVKWVAVDNLHLTLKFLGDVDLDAMPALETAVADACSGTPAFALTLGGIGAFPNTRRPNVIWVGATGQIEIAIQLAESIDDACAALGFAREDRPFAPHLTIGRVKRDVSPRDRQFIGEMIATTQVGTLGELHIDHVNVMKSDLRPTGSVYTRLATIQLQIKNDE